MTEIRPFRALRYDTGRVDLGRVIVPPYDVITPREREAFYQRDPHSAIRLELTRDVADEAATDYREVADTLAAWRRSGILRPDPQPALYALRQRFTAPDGTERVRDGFFALLRLEDYGQRMVRPHERTMSGPKADRLKQLRATRANLSSIFLLYEDADGSLDSLLAQRLAAEAPEKERAVDEAGLEHTLLPMADPRPIEQVCRFFAQRPVVIADGHHRYETALAYRAEARSAEPDAGSERPYEFVLGYFANAYAPGSLLLPIHRVVREVPAPGDESWAQRLSGWSEKRVAVSDASEIPGLLEQQLAPLSGQHAFAADDGSGVLRIFSRPSDGELTIRVVHRDVLGGVFGLDDAAVRAGAVGFPKHAREAARQVREGEGSVAIYLNPLRPEDVFRVTGAGELLPQKSTFFHPKLPSGLVFRCFADEEERV